MSNKVILITFIILTISTMNQLYAQENDKTFAPSNRVKVESIRFKNCFGITLAADLYMPLNATGKLPAMNCARSSMPNAPLTPKRERTPWPEE